MVLLTLIVVLKGLKPKRDKVLNQSLIHLELVPQILDASVLIRNVLDQDKTILNECNHLLSEFELLGGIFFLYFIAFVGLDYGSSCCSTFPLGL